MDRNYSTDKGIILNQASIVGNIDVQFHLFTIDTLCAVGIGP